MSTPKPARHVHAFWFGALRPDDWFANDSALDQRVAAAFGGFIPAARDGELAYWRVTPIGRLAEIVVLDQFSRNVFRHRPQAFAGDALALALAKAAIAAGGVDALSADERAFVYMPFMHSENLAEHDRAAALFAQPGLETQLGFEQRHRAVLERFGRYPQRNAALGRRSTPDEIAFLAERGASF